MAIALSACSNPAPPKLLRVEMTVREAIATVVTPSPSPESMKLGQLPLPQIAEPLTHTVELRFYLNRHIFLRQLNNPPRLIK